MAAWRPDLTRGVAKVSVIVLLVGGFVTAIPFVGAQTVQDATCAEPKPLDVGLVIDRSGSMSGDPLEVAQLGSQRLVENMTARDQSALVSYASDATLDKPLDDDHEETSTAIESLVAQGSTATGDGIHVSHENFRTSSREDARHVMIVLSDGHTNTGSDPVQQASEAKGDGIEIHAIGLGGDVNREELQTIASEPEETYFHQPQNAEELLLVFEAITANLATSPHVAEAFVAAGEAEEPGGPRLTVNKLGQQRSPTGGTGSISHLPVAVGGLLIEFETGNTSAQGSQDAETSTAAARTTVTNLTVTAADTDRVLVSAGTLTTRSQSAATTDSASSTADGTSLGTVHVEGHGSLEGPIPPNTRLNLPGTGEVILNEQQGETGFNHTRLLVNAIRMDLEPTETDPAINLVIGSAFSTASCETDERASIPQKSPARAIEQNLVTLPDVPEVRTDGYWMLHDPFAPLPEETDHVQEEHPGLFDVRRDRSESSQGDESSSYDRTRVTIAPADATVTFEWVYEEGPFGWRTDGYKGTGVGTLELCISGVCTEGSVFVEDRESTSDDSTTSWEREDHTLGADAEGFGVETERNENDQRAEVANTTRECFYVDAWAPFYLDTDAYIVTCESTRETDEYERTDRRVDVDGDQFTGFVNVYNDVTFVEDEEGTRPYLDGETETRQGGALFTEVDIEQERWIRGDAEDPYVEIETEIEIDLYTGDTIEIEQTLDATDGEAILTIEFETPAGDVSQTVTLPP